VVHHSTTALESRKGPSAGHCRGVKANGNQDENESMMHFIYIGALGLYLTHDLTTCAEFMWSS
jgi:hypothetical protein